MDLTLFKSEKKSIPKLSSICWTILWREMSLIRIYWRLLISRDKWLSIIKSRKIELFKNIEKNEVNEKTLILFDIKFERIWLRIENEWRGSLLKMKGLICNRLWRSILMKTLMN